MSKNMYISSVNNDKVKYWTKLLKSKKARDQHKQFIVEGFHLVEEAIKEGIVEQLIVTEQTHHQFSITDTYTVTDTVMKKICNTVTPQGVIAVCCNKNKEIQSFNRILLLDSVRDPGNIGTIIRTADAFNFDGVIMSEDTVDLYNPKVIRSTQGSLFRIPIIREPLETYINFLKGLNVSVYGTSLNGSPLSQVKLKEDKKVAIILGNEGSGVSQTLLDMTDQNLFIEMTGDSESLNVAVAAGIMMYNFKK